MVRSPTTLVRHGLRMYMWAEDRKICESLQKRGEWEPDVADAIEEYSRPDWTFLDLGAHIGFFSLMAARLNKHVIAVEPQIGAFEVLEKNIDLNEGSIEAHNVAVTETDGMVRMFLAVPGNTGMSWIARNPKEGTVSIRSRTLPSILDGRYPEFIKVDIEGSEYQAFKGCPEVLKRARVIITEYSESQLKRSSGCSGRDYYNLLRDTGFSLSLMNGSPAPFESLHNGYTNLIGVK